MSGQRPPEWQDLFSAGDPSGPKAPIQVRVIQRSGQPFLVLPADRRLAAKALALYPAQKLTARLARFALAQAFNFNLPLVPAAISLPINIEAPFAAFLTQTIGESRFPRFAILAGNPKAEGRRLIILLFNENNQPVTVVKAGIDESAMRLIEQEVSFLGAVPRDTPGMPRLCSTFRSPLAQALALDFVAGRSPDPDDAAGVESLLTSWIDRTRTIAISEIPAWKRLAACVDLDSTACRQLKSAVCHPVIYHGDFAPWNIKVSSGSWQALDWERGELTGVPGWDWFHYVIQSAVLVKRESADQLAARVEGLLNSAGFARYSSRAGIAGSERLLFLAYLNYSIQILKQTDGLPRIQSLLNRLSAVWT